MIDFTGIFEAVLALIGVVITAVIVPYIRSRTTARQRAELNAWVRIAVSAAEQIYTGSGRGAEKKEFVLSWLRGHAVAVDEDRLVTFVEAAVYALNNGLFAGEAE